jgi:hypothetical protein
MKSAIFGSLVLLSVLFSPLDSQASVTAAPSADFPPPAKVAVLIRSVYAPLGFDSNDNVQIVAEGFFSNSCYRPGPVDVNIDQNKKIIKIRSLAYHYSGMCLQVILPFDRVIDLGILQPGNYSIIQEGSPDKLEVLKVIRATSRNADDYIYAPISQAYFREKNGAPEIELSGEFTNSCMRLVDTKIMVQPKVILVQPIAALDAGADCQTGKFPFSKIVPLENVPKGRYLLHVRSMNAKAINTLVDID